MLPSCIAFSLYEYSILSLPFIIRRRTRSVWGAGGERRMDVEKETKEEPLRDGLGVEYAQYSICIVIHRVGKRDDHCQDTVSEQECE
jgi:hypothetical protein